MMYTLLARLKKCCPRSRIDPPFEDPLGEPETPAGDFTPTAQLSDQAAQRERVLQVESKNVQPYANGRDFLRDHLRRVALLVQACLQQRGVLQSSLTPEECIVQQESPFDPVPADSLSGEAVECKLQAARQLEREIEARWQATPRNRSRLFRLGRWLEFVSAETRRDARVRADRLPQLVALQRDLLLVALLAHARPLYRGLFMRLSTADMLRPGELTAGMAVEICSLGAGRGSEPTDLLRADLPLLQWPMLELGDAGLLPSLRPLRIDFALADYLLESPIARWLPGGVEIQSLPAVDVQLSSVFADDSTGGRLRELACRLTHDNATAFVLLHGPEGSAFHSAVAVALHDSAWKRIMTCELGDQLDDPQWHERVRRATMFARLERTAILWSRVTPLLELPPADRRWQQLVRLSSGLVSFATAHCSWDPPELSGFGSTPFVRIELPVPPIGSRRRIWNQRLQAGQLHLPAEQRDVALDLLAPFQFTPGQIADAIALAHGQMLTAPAAQAPLLTHLYEACRRISARGTVSFTRRIAPRKLTGAADPLDAVVLPRDAAQLLRELDYRLRHLDEIQYGYGFGERLQLGRGLIALFSGPSGTGKTLSASVLAGANERDLYQVDMSAVVSKYVGETEKNLARIFSDAQSMNAILFFDEADALFGKRGEVDKAQDRWANMEINYLLQRIEEFTGVVILASNLKQNIDPAFLRRVQVIIDFKEPNAEARQQILTAMLTADELIRPGDDELAAYSAQFDVVGGNLKNIALDAAFRALRDVRAGVEPDGHRRRMPIRIEHLVLATAREYAKLSRPVSQASFGRKYFEIVRHAFQSGQEA